MKNQICFMYTGQGSQYYGMAKILYEKKEVFREWMNYLNQVVVDVAGYSVTQELYDSKKTISNSFQKTQYTHPAIFMIEYSMTQLLLSMGVEPDFLIGSSLGEFVSLTVAGCESPEKILEFIVKQALLFEEKCIPGGMITILDNYMNYINNPLLNSNVELITVNYDKHFVISGDIYGINEMENYLKMKRISYFKVPVEYGFHSKNIDVIYNDYLALTQNLNSKTAKIPIYSSEEDDVIHGFTSELLWKIVRNKIKFNTTIQKIPNMEDGIFIDLGPSGTLAGFAKAILSKYNSVISIITPFNIEEKNLANLQNNVLLYDNLKH